MFKYIKKDFFRRKCKLLKINHKPSKVLFFKSFFGEYVLKFPRFRRDDFFYRSSAGIFVRFLAFLPKNSWKKASFSLLRFFLLPTSEARGKHRKRNEVQIKNNPGSINSINIWHIILDFFKLKLPLIPLIFFSFWGIFNGYKNKYKSCSLIIKYLWFYRGVFCFFHSEWSEKF